MDRIVPEFSTFPFAKTDADFKTKADGNVAIFSLIELISIVTIKRKKSTQETEVFSDFRKYLHFVCVYVCVYFLGLHTS